jgi:glutamyl-tRNA reductase
MSNKQQKAVEFIQEQLRKYVRYDNRSAVETFDKIFEQAKEMEKEQIKKAFRKGMVSNKTFDDYYNETYGGGNQ